MCTGYSKALLSIRWELMGMAYGVQTSTVLTGSRGVVLPRVVCGNHPRICSIFKGVHSRKRLGNPAEWNPPRPFAMPGEDTKDPCSSSETGSVFGLR